MVCISCILIPLALFIWHKFLQPIFGKMFGFGSVEDKTAADTGNADGAAAKMSCPFSSSGKNLTKCCQVFAFGLTAKLSPKA
jgi:hypothetical protein